MSRFEGEPLVGRPGAWSADISWRQRVKAVSRSAGLDVARWRPPEQRLRHFLERHAIDTVLDVGASGGQFGRVLRKAGFGGRIISFEPLDGPFGVLSAAAADDPRWEVRRVALGEARERRRINVSADTTSSSFLEVRERLVAAAADSRFVGTEEVAVERLDDAAAHLHLGRARVLLKLDVQGFQLPVLRGAEVTLGGVVALQCELSVLPLYEGEPPFLDTLLELRGRGFELVELEPGFYEPATGRLLQFDGRFVKGG